MPSKIRRVIIVIPCYNEEKRLDVDWIKEFTRRNGHITFLFVNDGSKDKTSAVLADLNRCNPECLLVHELPVNAGKAEAVRQGVAKALELNPDCIGYWDADMATPLEEIHRFCDILETMGHVEAVFGSRVMLLGRSIKRSSFRHYLGRLFATTVSALFRLPIYDTQCGAKVFRASEDVRRIFSEPFLSNWIFDVEIIARWMAVRRGTNMRPVDEIIYELPLSQWHHKGGSKINPMSYARSALDLVRLCYRYLP